MSRNMTKKLISHKGFLLLVIMCCVFSGFAGAGAATKKPRLSKKNVTLEVGKSVKIKVLSVNKKRKIKWSVKNKKIAMVKNGRITAKKKGKTKVFAVVDKKKLVCNVNVKSAGKKKTTEKKTSSPVPSATSQVTAIPQNTVFPSVEPTATAVPTATVVPTVIPDATATPLPFVTAPPDLGTYEEGLTSGSEEDFNKYFAKDSKNYTKQQDEAAAGEMKEITYESTVVGASREAYVYTPAGYGQDDIKYPVVYMLHGIGCDGSQWVSMNIANVLDNMIAQKEIKPVVAVFPGIIPKDGINKVTLSQENIHAFNIFIDEFTQDLEPYILKNYSVSEDRKDTGVCGLSMGGMEALELGFSLQNRFNYIGSFSAAPSLNTSVLHYTDINTIPEFVLLCNGTNDTTVGDNPLNYHKELTRNTVKHIWYQYPGEGHSVPVWINGAINFLLGSYGE